MPKCNKFSLQYTIPVAITPISPPRPTPSCCALPPPIPHCNPIGCSWQQQPLPLQPLQPLQRHHASLNNPPTKQIIPDVPLKHAPSYIAYESHAQHSCNVCVAGLHRQDAHRRRSCKQGARAPCKLVAFDSFSRADRRQLSHLTALHSLAGTHARARALFSRPFASPHPPFPSQNFSVARVDVKEILKAFDDPR